MNDRATRAGERTYAGIGSRATPERIQKTMEHIATELAQRGWTLRSGGAVGADSAFERGCDKSTGPKEIFIPWDGYDNRDGTGRKRQASERGVIVPPNMLQACQLSAKHWPPDSIPWPKLKRGTQALMGRNACQVLGADLTQPCAVVLFWKPSNGQRSGTDQALRIARAHKVECVRIFEHTKTDELIAWMEAPTPIEA